MGEGRAFAFVVLALTACRSARSDPRRDAPAAPASPAAPAAPASSATVAGGRTSSPDDWDQAVEDIEAEHGRLATAWQAARTPKARAAVRDRASRYLIDAIANRLAPPWLGMSWGMGRDSTALRPFEDGKTIACSYFVGAILAGAGFHLKDRFRLGQAAALIIQRSLVGAPGDVHRYYSIAPDRLAARIAALGDGVYVIGLDVHVGLVVVRGGEVRFVHASYTGDQVVSDEPLARAQAIANSQPKGYFVSPIVVAGGAADDWLVERWLAGDPVGP